jgi:hypothetical protein
VVAETSLSGFEFLACEEGLELRMQGDVLNREVARRSLLQSFVNLSDGVSAFP